jgi:hypothetical protein
MRKEPLNIKETLCINAKNESKKSKTKAYIFGDEKDATRVNELAKILNQHKIEMLELKEDVTINKRSSQKFKLYYSSESSKTQDLSMLFLINKPYSKTVYFMTFQLEF